LTHEKEKSYRVGKLFQNFSESNFPYGLTTISRHSESSPFISSVVEKPVIHSVKKQQKCRDLSYLKQNHQSSELSQNVVIQSEAKNPY